MTSVLLPAVATANYQTYLAEGQRRLAERQAKDEAERQADLVARWKKNREEWQAVLAPAFAALPSDLHMYIKYDETIEPTNSTYSAHYGITQKYHPAHLDYVPHVDIEVRWFDYAYLFAAQRAERIRDEDDHIWIEYRDGTRFVDPLMAIAEADTFVAHNARMEYQCSLMKQAADGDQFAQHELEAEFGVKPNAPAIAPQPVAPPEPTELENLLADAWRLLDDGDSQGSIAASAVVIAECLHAMSKGNTLAF